MKPCYDVPRMLRELADEIESEEGIAHQVALVLHRFDEDDLSESIQVSGYGQFMNASQTIKTLADGIKDLAEGAIEEESDDGCEIE